MSALHGRHDAVPVMFYAGCTLTLAALCLQLQEGLLPTDLADRVGRNGEALLLALLIAAVVEATPAEPRTTRSATALLLTAAGLMTGSALLAASALPMNLITLHEALLGAGLICVYLAPPRPWRWVVWLVGVAAVGVALLLEAGTVVDEAEALAPFLLAPVALGVVERGTLDPSRPDRPGLRLAWMALLVASLAATMMAAPWARQSLDDPLTVGIDYAQRAAEALLAWLIVHAYLWLRHVSAGADDARGTGDKSALA